MLAFIDESGFPHPNDDTERPVLATVCIPKDQIRNILVRMYNIRQDVFGRGDYELKASNVLNKKSVTHFHQRKLFTDRVVDEVLCGILGIKVFAIVMTKPSTFPTYNKDYFQNHYRFLLQRINAYAHSQRKHCIVAFDSQDEGNDKIISTRMKNYLFRSQEGRETITAIVESAFFVSSKVEDGIQLADLCAGIIRKYHEMNASEQSPYTNWIESLYGKISRLSVNLNSPGTRQLLYGIYQMPERLLFEE
jgi:hypothetical protein